MSERGDSEEISPRLKNHCSKFDNAITIKIPCTSSYKLEVIFVLF